MKTKILLGLILLLWFFPAPVKAGGTPLTLKDCIKLGLAQNPNLKARASQVDQAQAKTGEIKSARDIKLATGGNYTITTPEIQFTTPGGPGQPAQTGIIIPNQAYNVNLTLSKFVTNFGLLESQTALAALQADTNRMNFKIARRDLIYNISSAYLQSLRNKGLQNLSAQTHKAWQEHLKQTQSLYNSGVVSKYDVLRSEVEVSKAQDQVTTSDKSVNLAFAGLKSLMGLSGPEPLELAPDNLDQSFSPETLKNLDLQSAKQLALSNRYEMKLMDLIIGQSETALKIAKTGNNPSLSAGTSYSSKTATFMSRDWQWQTYLNLNFPFYTGTERPAKIRQAEEAIKQARFNREDIALKLGLEVENYWLSFREADQYRQTAEAQLQQATEGLRVADLRYQEGLSTGVERVDAQTALTSAQTNSENTKYGYFEAALNLTRALGELDEISAKKKVNSSQ